MTYKLNEADEFWRPLLRFDSDTKQWIPSLDGDLPLYYEVLSAEATGDLLNSSPEIVLERELPLALRMNILRCATLFHGSSTRVDIGAKI